MKKRFKVYASSLEAELRSQAKVIGDQLRKYADGTVICLEQMESTYWVKLPINPWRDEVTHDSNQAFFFRVNDNDFTMFKREEGRGGLYIPSIDIAFIKEAYLAWGNNPKVVAVTDVDPLVDDYFYEENQ